jgi:hypothetical protein
MANPEHVKIVLAGRDALGEWRKSHRAQLDLTAADLRGTNLSGADLSRAILNGSELGGANLSGANLDDASLNDAKLSGAHLIYASLIHANLGRAFLRAADLTEANLGATRLIGADLSLANVCGTNLIDASLNGADLTETTLIRSKVDGADLAKASLGRTTLADVDLSAVQNLNSVYHRAASTIGIDTLVRSRGKIPDAFLRGCGLPEELITYLPSLIGNVFDFYSCFISYSGKDDDFVQRLYSRLQLEKLRVWFAPEDMKGGRESYHQIDSAIRIHDKLLIVLSAASMASEWVKLEIKKAIDAGMKEGRQKLFPISLCGFGKLEKWKCLDDRGNDLAVEVRKFHIPDFGDWKNHDAFEKAFKRLLRDLRKGEPTARPTPVSERNSESVTEMVDINGVSAADILKKYTQRRPVQHES